MSRFRRSTVAADSAPERKKKRFSLFRHSISGDVNALATISQVVQAPDDATTPTNPTSTDTSSLIPSSSSSQSVTAPESVSSHASSSDDHNHRNRGASISGQLERVQEAEDAATPSGNSPGTKPADDGPPSYASATRPSAAATYQFTRTSPFAMVLEHEDLSGHGLYHISVGVNIWIPTCTVTTIRRGPTEDGPIVARLELGISSTAATIQMGDVCKPINEVFFRRSTTSNSRLYFTGDGSAIKWRLGSQKWQAFTSTTLLADFIPTPPRKLMLQADGHRLADHIIISLLILMREHLTPAAGMRGDAAQLFNYSPHHNYRED